MTVNKLTNFLCAALTALLVLTFPAMGQTPPKPMNECTITIIATGGSAVTAIAANLNRQYLLIQNPSATPSGVSAESLFVSADTTATTDGHSIELANASTANAGTVIFSAPGYVPTGPISVIAATTNHKFVCKWN